MAGHVAAAVKNYPYGRRQATRIGAVVGVVVAALLIGTVAVPTIVRDPRGVVAEVATTHTKTERTRTLSSGAGVSGPRAEAGNPLVVTKETVEPASAWDYFSSPPLSIWASFLLAILAGLFAASAAQRAAVGKFGFSFGLLAMKDIGDAEDKIRSAASEVHRATEDAEAGATDPEDVREQAVQTVDTTGLAAYIEGPGIDTNLRFVALRIAIEMRLRQLAEIAIPDARPRMALGRLVRELTTAEVLPRRTSGPLRELVELGNRAAHGERVPAGADAYAADLGPQLLSDLDRLIIIQRVEAFEREVRAWAESQGFSVAAGAADQGVDFIATTGGGTAVAVETKATGRPLGVASVQRLVGRPRPAQRLVLISASGFTEEARATARDAQVDLIDWRDEAQRRLAVDQPQPPASR